MKSLMCYIALIGVVTVISCDTVRPFLISEQQEIEVGNSLKAQIVKDTKTYPPFTGDQRVKRFVDSLGQVLVKVQGDRPQMEFTFTILDDDNSINAFAIPGGHVFVYTGLLKAVDNTAELAGVLAHEIGHITKYHGADMMVANGLSGIVNQILFGDDSTIVRAATTLLQNLSFLKFSRKNEFEADECAVTYVSAAGINPKGVSDFFQKLKDTYGDEQKVFEPLSTHPLLSDRISNVKKTIEKNKNVPTGDEYLYRDKYHQIRNIL